ncbi:MAG: 2-oxo acid dehydrogenase subunit E2 [Actinomycetota bacterium]|nr:2-oxo acid dehydrogenase subunit E2 [Actinomycetota bacterium]
MATEVKMPQLGETVVEGTITKWLKQEGDQIEEDELLVEVSTDKVDSEVPSSAAGVIQKILVPEGETVSVGTPLAVIGADGEGAASGTDDSAEQPPAEPRDEGGESAPQAAAQQEQQGEQDQSEKSGQGGDAEPDKDEAAAAAASATAAPAADEGDAGAEESRGGGGEAPATKQEGDGQQTQARASSGGDSSKRGIISPLVRRLADEHGVNLDDVEGTGTGGRIRKQDVLKFVESGKKPRRREEEQPAAAQSQPAQQQPAAEAQSEQREPEPAGQREELVPWTNIRRRTAEHMVASHMETARAWNAVEVDWTDVVEVRTRAKNRFKEKEGFSLTYMPFLARAVCDTLLEMPEVNSTYDAENESTRVKHYVNLGIAVALEGGGLIVPVVKGADEKNLTGIARGIHDVASRARSKKLSPDDLAGGTFTITNPGPFGSKLSVPIIPRGQTAILAFEAIEKRVVVTDDDAIAIRSRGYLPLAWDHRTIDGAEAARFLARLKERIETTDWSSELSAFL